MSYEANSSGMSTAGGRRTITAFYDSRTDADEAIERLVAAGVSRSDIRLVPGREGGQTSTYSQADEGGFWDALKDLFLPDEDRHVYAEGLQRGGYLVTVTTSERSYDAALDILDDEGTIDIGERESSWRSQGWTGYSGSTGLGAATTLGGTAPGTTGSSSFGSTASDTISTARAGSVGTDEVIPVAEEELRVGKRDVSHGRVRVRSYVVETPVSEQVSLREESVHVERRPVDRPLTGNEALFQDRTIEVEERAEEAVVAKEARVREELVINKQVGERVETVTDTVRHTEVEIEDERTGSLNHGTGRSGI
jgi:uncharacterized protein (TIGR02271 family)